MVMIKETKRKKKHKTKRIKIIKRGHMEIPYEFELVVKNER